MKRDGSRRSLLRAGLLAGLAAACAREPTEAARAGQRSQALFSNGGFELGNLGSWTLTTYSNTAAGLPQDPSVTPPQTVADLGLVGGGVARSHARTGTAEAQIPWGLSGASPASTLRYPRYGSWTGVVNEGGANRNANSLKQSSVATSADVDPVDGRVHVRFALAPVLQNPGHTARQQPYFFVVVRNLSRGGTLFSTFNFANQAGVPWVGITDSGGEQVLYTDWQAFDVAAAPSELAVGDRVELEVVAVGCALGGHYGEVYVDAFGSTLPGISIVKTAPAQANPGTDFAYTFVARNNGASAATSVVMAETLPAQTTFVSAEAPGAACSTPPVGGTGSIVCVLASLEAGATYTFSVSVRVDGGATGKISNGNYSIRAAGVSPLLGPLVETNTTCAVDADCAVGFFCESGACAPKRAKGAACAGDRECLDAHCAGGICCDRACGGACEACDRPGAAGTCTSAPAGSPGDPPCAPYRCDGTGSACPASCSSGAGCAEGFYCAAGSCAAQREDGASCTAAEQCASGHCADGVCCDSACGGACDACDLPGSGGTCSPIAAGSPGSPSCAPYLCSGAGASCPSSCSSDAACAEGAFCSGGQCIPKLADGALCAADRACAHGFCVDGVCCEAACVGACDACNLPGFEGRCARLAPGSPGNPACTPYVCTGLGAACPAACSGDAACAEGHFCAAGACTLKKGLGVVCAGGRECASGLCADGVCCDSACAGACDACNIGAVIGTCGLLPAGAAGSPSCAPYVCAGDSASCPASCAGDAQCAPGHYCAAGACAPKKPKGSACTVGRECATGACADGVCCDGPCSGACDTCSAPGAVGTCAPRPAGSAGEPSCSPYVCGGSSAACPSSCAADSSCAAGHYCAGGACLPEKAGGAPCSAPSQCASGFCADGVCCDAPCTGACDACNAQGSAGTCAILPAGAAGSPSCSPYACGGLSAACPTSCAASAACAAGFYCEAGACKPRRELGEACASDESCASSHCVDGVCCNSTCLGQCEACDAAGSAGTCVPVAGAPRGSRPPCAGDGSVCAGSCSGADRRACAYPSQRTPCRSGSCEAGIATLAAGCDGHGACPALQTVACGAYPCAGARCAGDCAQDADCAAGSFCAGGLCKPKLDAGVPCASASQCSSGHCADGVCCDQACQGQCEACDLAGKRGACAPVSGAPRGGRAACATDGTECAGTCDGAHRAACAYPGASVPCRAAFCAQGVAILAAACDGAGACPGAQAVVCAPYLCGAAACAGDCQRDGDCAAASYCAAGICKPKLDAGVPCASASQCSSGHCADGVCCDSECLGQCEACDAPGAVGTCAPVAGAPRRQRAACESDGSACGGTCDGASRAGCVYPRAPCRPARCEAGIAVLAAACDGQGACPAAQTQTCAPYACGDLACRGDCAQDADCAAGRFCAGGVCKPKLDAGVPCASAAQCSSGHCADGVCCDRACAGQCEACDAAGSEGTCGPVAGAPRGGRPSCAGAGLCQGRCGGELGDRCSYPGPEVICSPATCEDGVRRAQASCDGQGRCGDSAEAECGGFACAGLDCKASCAWDGDCASKAVCVNGVCRRLAPSELAMAGGCGCGAGAGEGGIVVAALAAAAASGRRRQRRA